MLRIQLDSFFLSFVNRKKYTFAFKMQFSCISFVVIDTVALSLQWINCVLIQDIPGFSFCVHSGELCSNTKVPDFAIARRFQTMIWLCVINRMENILMFLIRVLNAIVG